MRPVCPSRGFTEQSLCCTCRLKSLTLFSHFTAKAATVSSTNSLLSSYICSGQGFKDGGRSCPCFSCSLGFMSNTVYFIREQDQSVTLDPGPLTYYFLFMTAASRQVAGFIEFRLYSTLMQKCLIIIEFPLLGSTHPAT